MYRGFNLEIKDKIDGDDYLDTGKSIEKDLEDNFKERIEDFVGYNDIINGNEVIKEWFPVIESDVFLSHSHIDKEKALYLAGYLKNNFGLKTFIDSSVWGYSDVLLKLLDDKFCLNENNNTYSYISRNYSTSHVHLMLKSALDKMIDKCEAIFFLNTPNSVSIDNSVEQKTKSPWIFSEIATTQIIRKNTPKRLKKETRLFSTESKLEMNENTKNRLQVEYELELNHLTRLDLYDLKLWKNEFKYSYKNALDVLYSKHPIDRKFLI